MQLVKLGIKNFLSITDVEIAPGQVNQIVGQNNQGKTTIIRALETALKGSTDGSLVRNGSEMAEIILEFDNDLKVHRKIRADGKQGVQVKRGDFAADKPQTMLDGLMAGISFNPLALLDHKERVKALMQAIDIRLTEEQVKSQLGDCPVPVPPVDYNQHGLVVAEQVHKYLYQRRAEANKEAKRKADIYTVKLSEAPAVLADKLPKMPEVDGHTLRSQIESLKLSVKEELQKEAHRVRAEEKATMCFQLELRAKEHITKLQRELEQATGVLELRKKEYDIARKAADAMVVDTEKINAANAEADKLQAELDARAYEAQVTAQKETLWQLRSAADEAKSFAEKLDGAVEAVGPAFRAKMVSEADLPIAGLEYRDGQFFLNGSSIDNLSSSASLKLAITLARRIAKETKIICIDGAELLDDESFAELRREIEGDGFTYFITKVGPAFQPHSVNDNIVTMEKGSVQ